MIPPGWPCRRGSTLPPDPSARCPLPAVPRCDIRAVPSCSARRFFCPPPCRAPLDQPLLLPFANSPECVHLAYFTTQDKREGHVVHPEHENNEVQKVAIRRAVVSNVECVPRE